MSVSKGIPLSFHNQSHVQLSSQHFSSLYMAYGNETCRDVSYTRNLFSTRGLFLHQRPFYSFRKYSLTALATSRGPRLSIPKWSSAGNSFISEREKTAESCFI